jgi:hypothetical protein
MQMIYRADRVRAVFCIVLGGLFAASGAQAIALIGFRSEVILTCVLAAATLGVAVCILLTRVAVDDSGLDRRAPLAGGFRVSWDQVESWWVHRGNVRRDTLPQACFRLWGQRSNLVVHAADVSRPGFDTFLADVRARLGDRETADPDPGPDGA